VRYSLQLDDCYGVKSGGRGEHGPASGLPLSADMTKASAVFGLGPNPGLGSCASALRYMLRGSGFHTLMGTPYLYCWITGVFRLPICANRATTTPRCTLGSYHVRS
jgi:hypothetical protein